MYEIISAEHTWFEGVTYGVIENEEEKKKRSTSWMILYLHSDKFLFYLLNAILFR
jgi:hypothetical protein